MRSERADSTSTRVSKAWLTTSIPQANANTTSTSQIPTPIQLCSRRIVALPAEHRIHTHPLALALELPQAAIHHPQAGRITQRLVGGVADQNVGTELAIQGLDARAQVDCIADRGVLHASLC